MHPRPGHPFYRWGQASCSTHTHHPPPSQGCGSQHCALLHLHLSDDVYSRGSTDLPAGSLSPDPAGASSMRGLTSMRAL